MDALRHTNLDRAREFWAGVERSDIHDGFQDLRLDPAEIQDNRARLASSLKLPPAADGFYGHAESTSLLELLPEFLALSAAQAALNRTNISDTLMTLAATFMVQAALEQYFVYGARGPAALLQAFAWGWRPSPGTSWADEALVNRMFRDEDLEQEIDGWGEKRDGYLEVVSLPAWPAHLSGTPGALTHGQLQPSDPDASLHQHLKMIAKKVPLDNLEDAVLDYLEGLLDSLPAPALNQLERGHVDGLSHGETQALLQRARFFGPS